MQTKASVVLFTNPSARAGYDTRSKGLCGTIYQPLRSGRIWHKVQRPLWYYLPTPPLGQDMTQGPKASVVLFTNPSARAGYDTRSKDLCGTIYQPLRSGRIWHKVQRPLWYYLPTPPLGQDMTQGPKASVVLFTNPSARAGYDTRSKGLCGTIYQPLRSGRIWHKVQRPLWYYLPTPPLGQDMTQGPKASVVLFTQPLRSGRIWHKVQRPLWYYLPNPSARAGYDTRSKGLCGTIYQPLRSGRIWHKVQRPLWYYLPTPPLGQDMTQGPKASVVLFTNPSARAGYDTRSKGLCGTIYQRLRSGRIWHKVQRPLWYYLPTPPLGQDMTQGPKASVVLFTSPSAQAGSDTRSKGLCGTIYPTPPLRQDMTQGPKASVVLFTNPSARAGYDTRSKGLCGTIYPTPPLGQDMTQGPKASVVLFTNPSARAGYDTRSKGLCGTIYPTPPLGQDMTQGPKASVVLFTNPSARAGYDTRSKGLCGTIYQPLRSGRIWHKVQRPLWYYLPNPSARAGYDTRSKGLCGTIYQPLRSGRIWHKVQRPLWYYLPNPSARAGYDTRSKGLCGTIYPTPPLGQDMTQGPKASVVY